MLGAAIVKKNIFVLALGLSVGWAAVALARDAEKPFSEDEVVKFMADYPAMIQWSRKGLHDQGQVNHPWVIAGMRYDKGFVEQLTAKGWDADRFFYIFNHVNQGIMAKNAKEKQAQALARSQENMKKVQDEARASREAGAKAMEAAASERQSWMNRQLDAEERRIRQNPYMNPWQRQQALDLIRSQRDQVQKSAVQPFTPEDSAKKMQQWQAAAQQSQRDAIVRNPFIPGAQKYWMIRQMQASTRQGSGATLDPKQTREQTIRQQKDWMAKHKAEMANNPFIPPEQRRIMSQQAQKLVQTMEEGMQKNPPQVGLLQEGEMELVEKYGDRLLQVFQQP